MVLSPKTRRGSGRGSSGRVVVILVVVGPGGGRLGGTRGETSPTTPVRKVRCVRTCPAHRVSVTVPPTTQGRLSALFPKSFNVPFFSVGVRTPSTFHNRQERRRPRTSVFRGVEVRRITFLRCLRGRLLHPRIYGGGP